MGRNMGWDFGLSDPNTVYKRKHRWLFKIPDVSAEGVNCLAPAKSARPSVSFKEIEVQHLNETVYFPGKPEWKPVALTLYDICQGQPSGSHPVFEWIKKVYDPSGDGTYRPSCDGFKVDHATLELYDGCGNVIETWTFEAAWPQSVEFGELDMSTAEVLTCDISLRYDRAYISQNNG
jgi:hypothetical protein